MAWQPATTISTERRVSVPAIVVVAVGVAAIVLWLFVLDFAGSQGIGFTFADVRTAADLSDVDGFPGAWYSWIAYASAAVAVLFAVLTLIPGPAQPGLRVAAVAFSAAGLVLAFLALADGDRGIELGDRRVGFWVGMAGFVLLLVGSLLRASPVVTVATPTPTATAWDPTQSWSNAPGAAGAASPGQSAGVPVAGAAWPGQQPGGAPASGATWTGQPASNATGDLWAATAPAAAVAAGWHADPTGRNEQRWWDGQAWSAHVVRGGVQTTDPL